jgi:hypothetical protein
MNENEKVLTPDEMSEAELDAATSPEGNENAVPPATELSDEELREQMLAEDNPVEDNPVEEQPAGMTPGIVQDPERPRQGNTDPRDFDAFDAGGNFIEKRDR